MDRNGPEQVVEMDPNGKVHCIRADVSKIWDWNKPKQTGCWLRTGHWNRLEKT